MCVKKRKRSIFIIITCVIVQVILLGCGKTEEMKVESSIEVLQKTEILPDKYTLLENRRMTSVHMECGGHSGSGIIWEITDNSVVLLSNRHLLEHADTVDVSFASGVYYQADVVFLSEEYDFGLAEINRNEMDKEDIAVLSAVSYHLEAEEDRIIGETLFIISSKEYPADNVLEGALVETSSYVETEMLYTPQEMMLGKLTGTEELSVESGMSGSGVFDAKGDFIGIISGGDGGKEYMAVPIWNILTGMKN